MVRKLIAIAAGVFALVASSAFVQAAEKIVIAALPFVSSSPLFVAQEKGYFAAEGLEAEIKLFQAAQPVAVAVASGDADFGVTAYTGGFFNLAGKGALKVIGAQSAEVPGYDFSAYMASNQAHAAGLTSPEKIKGHTFAMTQVGSSFHYMLGLLADKRGFSLKDVDMKPLQSVPNMIGAVKSGQADSMIMVAHIAKPLADSGAAKIIGWVHEETPWQLGALFTSAKNVADRRALVAKFVRAYQRGATDYNAAMNERDGGGKRVFGAKADALIPLINKYVGPNPTPEKTKAGAPYIDPLGRIDVADVYKQVKWYQAEGLVDKDVDPKSFLDLSFIKGHFNVPK